MQEKKNVPQRLHTVRNVTGRSYEFALETVIEMHISGHADFRFFFVITVLLCLKLESASCPSLIRRSLGVRKLLLDIGIPQQKL